MLGDGEGEKNNLEGEFGGLGKARQDPAALSVPPKIRAGSIWDAALWLGAGCGERSSAGTVSQNASIISVGKHPRDDRVRGVPTL